MHTSLKTQFGSILKKLFWSLVILQITISKTLHFLLNPLKSHFDLTYPSNLHYGPMILKPPPPLENLSPAAPKPEIDQKHRGNLLNLDPLRSF